MPWAKEDLALLHIASLAWTCVTVVSQYLSQLISVHSLCCALGISSSCKFCCLCWAIVIYGSLTSRGHFTQWSAVCGKMPLWRLYYICILIPPHSWILHLLFLMFRAGSSQSHYFSVSNLHFNDFCIHFIHSAFWVSGSCRGISLILKYIVCTQ